MTFYTQNIEDATVTVTAGTAHASYPIGNLTSLVKSKTFRTAAGSAVTIDLKIDLGAARSCSYILLGGLSSGLYTGGDIFNLWYGTADNGTDFENNILADQAINKENKVYTFQAASKRYWKLEFEEFDANAADYISHVFMGASYTTPNSGELNNTIGYDYSNVIQVQNNAYQQRYAVEDRRFYESTTIRGFTEAQKDAFISHFNTYCDGTLKPFYFTRDDRSTVSFGHFGNNPFQFRKVTKDFYETTLEIYEQL